MGTKERNGVNFIPLPYSGSQIPTGLKLLAFIFVIPEKERPARAATGFPFRSNK